MFYSISFIIRHKQFEIAFWRENVNVLPYIQHETLYWATFHCTVTFMCADGRVRRQTGGRTVRCMGGRTDGCALSIYLLVLPTPPRAFLAGTARQGSEKE